MKNVVLVSLLVGLAACGDDGPTNSTKTPTNNTQPVVSECVPSAGGIELCDGLDNNCDGSIDEDFADLGTPCTAGLGACAAEGVLVCSIDKTTTVCDAVIAEPSDEICDDIDNDCDGETDEGFEIGTLCSAGEGTCANDGEIVCLNDGSAACNAVEGSMGSLEICNGMDDDCDDLIDETFDELGETCTLGVGACAATGVKTCAEDGNAVTCNASPGTPADEVCDGVDNDCDDEVDEGFDLGTACTAGLGVCLQSGQIICHTDGTSLCSAIPLTPPEASERTCDGLDNDCDGAIDEECDKDSDGYCDADFTRVGSPAVCPLGGNDCNDTQAAINPAATEVCDGADNNCSGSTDINAVDASTHYLDCDGDGYAADSIGNLAMCSAPPNSNASTACNQSQARWTTRAPSSPNVDCHPTNATVFPGQTQYSIATIANRPAGLLSHDYNCNGSNERQWNSVNVSTTASCPNGALLGFPATCLPPLNFNTTPPTTGWTGSELPNCGIQGTFTTCSYSNTPVNGACPGTRTTSSVVQGCR